MDRLIKSPGVNVDIQSKAKKIGKVKEWENHILERYLETFIAPNMVVGQ